MLQEVLSLGDKIDIKPIGRNGRPVLSVRTFISQLIDFVDVDVINIAAPIVLGKTILLSVGESYNLCFYTEKGLYQCNSIVLSNHKENKTVISVVRIITNLEKFQRRQYFRLECIHDIEYRVISIEESILDRKMSTEDFVNAEERAECRMKLNQFNREWMSASVTDLSGGGLKFTSEMSHNSGDKLRIKLDFLLSRDVKKLVLGANVISSNRILNRMGAYEHRVEFTDIMQKDREALIKYIFEQDRKRRRNDKS